MEWLSDIWIFNAVIKPMLDVLILTFIIYKVYQLLVQTRAVQLVRGAVIIAVIYAAAFFLKLETLLWILNRLATVIVIIIAIVFQPELRNLFMRIGRGNWFRLSSRSKPQHLDSVLNAVDILSGRRRGCLIVFTRKVGLKNVIETGTRLNADLSSSLILSAFGYDTPLHDGAMFIQSGKIVAAGCFLPLSEQADIRRSFGTRHRAALGLTEVSDAIVIVVSEETGAISLAFDGKLFYDLSLEEVRRNVKRLLNVREEPENVIEEQPVED
jgi:diadenylate cyclase